MRVRNVTRVLAPLVLLQALGCGATLERKVRRGEYEAVVAEVEGRRRPPTGRVARAYARALVAQGKSDAARDALVYAFRRGGDVRSLGLLGDLERDAGHPSMAALHYARAHDLDPGVFFGRSDVCRHFEARAQALVDVGEGRAAETFLRRSVQLCPEPSAAEATRRAVLARLVDTVANQEVAAEIRRNAPPVAEEPAIGEVERRWSVEEIVASVLAEGRGELELDLLPTHVLRRRIAERTWSDFAPIVMATSESEQAYLQLRLAPVLASMPQAPAPFRGPREADIWVAKALELPGARTWRLLGWLGDLPSAELELRTAFDGPRNGAATPPESTSPEVPEHWSGRVPASPELLVVARLRAAAGRRELALRLLRRHVQGSDGTAWAEAEATRALAWGDPWHALALADAAPEPVSPALRAAMDTALALAVAVCDGPCDDADDFEVVRAVMGDGWLETQLQRIEAPRPAVEEALGCPGQSEALRSTLVAAWRHPGPPADARDLTRALASEMVWACAGAWILPLLAAHPDPRGEATRWLEAVALTSPLAGSTELSVAGRIAVLTGDPQRAEPWLERAAATAMVPEQVWWDAVRLARDVQAWEVERWALHRLAVSAASPAKEVARRELLVHAVRDGERSWAERETPHGREAVIQQIEEVLASVPEERRWAFRQALAVRLQAVARAEGWAPDRLAALGFEAPPGGAPSPWDDDALTVAAREGRTRAVPEVTRALGDPRAFEGLRLALAERARDWAMRRRMAIGLAVTGTASARLRALAVLREVAGERGRFRVDAVALAGAKGLAPGHTPARAVPLLGEPGVTARVVFGLDLEPALVAPSGP